MAKLLRYMGVFTSVSIPGKIIRLQQENARAQIEEFVSYLKAEHRPAIVVIILSTGAKKGGILARWACDVIHGLPSIECAEDQFTHADREWLARTGLKMNLKLGGENHTVDWLGSEFTARGETMIVGIKVNVVQSAVGHAFHTITGLVTSVDARLAQWPGKAYLQPGGRQVITNIGVMLQSRIRSWAKANGNKPPENIVIYRSMPRLGKYESLVDIELRLIRNACRATYLAAQGKVQEPRITIVLVDEKDGTWFFPTSDTEGDRSGTPVAGTVVDRGILDPRQWDFFLQSHSCKETTSQPTRYLVVVDEVFRRQCHVQCGPADVLQNFTHRLCYLSGETTKARRVCTPIYYANEACARVHPYYQLPGAIYRPSGDEGVANLVQIHPAIRNTMFYL